MHFGVEVGLIGRLDYFLMGSVVSVVFDVIADCFVEENGFLADHSQVRTEEMDVVVL
jgi:hypothetical protein